MKEKLYQENRLTPIFEKMKDKKVAVIGVGAIGSFICECLIRNGAGYIAALDLDKYEPHNIPKSSFAIHYPDDIGQSKAKALSNRLCAYAKEDCTIHGYYINLRKIGPYALKDFDYVIAALDNLSIKIFLQTLVKQCPERQPILLSCGTNREHSEALIFAPKGACLRCTIPDSWLQSENPETVHSCAAKINYLLPQKTLPIVSTSGIASMKAAADIDDMVTGHVMGDLELNESLRYIQDTFPIKDGRLLTIMKSKSCPVCDLAPPESFTVLNGATRTTTLKQLLIQIKEHCDFDFKLRVHMLEIHGAPSQIYNQFVIKDNCQYCGKEVDVCKHAGEIRQSEIICEKCKKTPDCKSLANDSAPFAVTEFSLEETDEGILNMTLFDLGYPIGCFYQVEKNISNVFKEESEMDFDNLFDETAQEIIFVLKDDSKYLFEEGDN